MVKQNARVVLRTTLVFEFSVKLAYKRLPLHSRDSVHTRTGIMQSENNIHTRKKTLPPLHPPPSTRHPPCTPTASPPGPRSAGTCRRAGSRTEALRPTQETSASTASATALASAPRTHCTRWLPLA